MEAAACTRDATTEVIETVFTLPAADILEMKKYTFTAKMKLTEDAVSQDPYFVNWEIAGAGIATPVVESSEFVSK